VTADERTEANVIVIMGVAGAGKTAVGRALADALHWRFVEGDDYHPRANVEKMSHGMPLSDDDRRPWLEALRSVIAAAVHDGEHAVVACSALKHAYRETLRVPDAPPGAIRFVYLDVPRAVLAERLAMRQHHFAPPALLDSQLDTLEKPRDALWVDGTLPVLAIVDRVVTALHLSTE
jgi:carbohydrate kinase (thermoresistant glucokinase family)